MLDAKERLDRMTTEFPDRKPSNHCKVASTVLSRLGKELLERGISCRDDGTWAFHILVPDGRGRWISLFCGGFSKAIDIQLLKKDGTPDRRVREVRYLTPVGAANYIRKRYGSGAY